jgi:hypothetical protein
VRAVQSLKYNRYFFERKIPEILSFFKALPTSRLRKWASQKYLFVMSSKVIIYSAKREVGLRGFTTGIDLRSDGETLLTCRLLFRALYRI